MRRTVWSLVLVTIVGCGGLSTTTVQVERPVDLPTGQPQNGCEQQHFVEVVPSRRFSSGSQSVTGYYVTTTTVSNEAATGLALYSPGGKKPIQLPKVLPYMNEPGLASLHMGRIAPILAKQKRRAKWTSWLWWGAGIALTGVVITLAGIDDGTAVAVGLTTALGGLTIEGIGAVGMAVNNPTAQEQSYGSLRRVLFLPGEDDLEAVKRGAAYFNENVRKECGAQ